MTFKEDLLKGEEVEQLVIEALNKEGVRVIKNPDEKWMDLLEVKPHWMEIKADHYNHNNWKDWEKGNAYIEYECYGNPSWIMKKEKHELGKWIHSFAPYQAFVFNGKYLRTFVVNTIEKCSKNKSNTYKGCRLVSWWDWKLSKGLLIPVEQFKALAEKELIL